MFSSDRLRRIKTARKVLRSQSEPAVLVYPAADVASTDDETVSIPRRLRGRRNNTRRSSTNIQRADKFDAPHSSTEMSSASSTGELGFVAKPSSNGSISGSRRQRSHPLVKALVAALQKEHMLDVTLIGKDSAEVRASRYVLACQCESLEKKLYNSAAKNTFDSQHHPERVHVGDYTEEVLRGVVEFCFTGELKSFALDSSRATVENLASLQEFSQDYKFLPLHNEIYQLSRKLMNCHPSVACVFYQVFDSGEIQDYALQTLRECPQEAFRDETALCQVSASRMLPLVEEVVEGDIDPLELVRMLSRWKNNSLNSQQEATHVAQQCAMLIDLSRILSLSESSLTMLHESGLFDEATIEQATRCGSPHSMVQTHLDRVDIKGAMEGCVNGVYYKDEESDETNDCPLYIKDLCDDDKTMELFLWGSTWHIASSSDLSHSYYTCEAGDQGDSVIPPCLGWKASDDMSTHPPLNCTWIPRGEQDASRRNSNNINRGLRATAA